MVTVCLLQEYVSWLCEKDSKEDNKKGRGEEGKRGKR